MDYNQQQQNLNYPPEYCNYGTMCNAEPEVIAVEVQKISGKRMITTYGHVCVKTGVGNITNELSPDFTFIRWLAWCSGCFMLHNDKMLEAKEHSQAEMEV